MNEAPRPPARMNERALLYETWRAQHDLAWATKNVAERLALLTNAIETYKVFQKLPRDSDIPAHVDIDLSLFEKEEEHWKLLHAVMEFQNAIEQSQTQTDSEDELTRRAQLRVQLQEAEEALENFEFLNKKLLKNS